MKTRLLFASLILSQLLTAQRLILPNMDPQIQKLLLQADTAFYRGEYAKSIEIYRQLSPDDPKILFNLATAYVGSGQYDSAFQALFKSGLDQIKYTEELAPLHQLAKWKALVNMIDARYKQLKKPGIAKELNRRFYYDQKYQMIGTLKRRFPHAYPQYSFDQLDSLMKVVFRENVQYIKRTGFLWKDDIGEEGVHTIWVIAQHADFDTAFQRGYLREMRRHDANKQDYAYLTDRVNKNAGEKQVYGTQMKYVGGKMMLWPVVDSAHLDERRREVGLQPIAEYLQGVRLLNNH